MPHGQAALTSCGFKARLLYCTTHSLENNQLSLPAASLSPPVPTGSKRGEGSGTSVYTTLQSTLFLLALPHPPKWVRSSFLLKWGRGDSKSEGTEEDGRVQKEGRVRVARGLPWPRCSAEEPFLPTRDSGLRRGTRPQEAARLLTGEAQTSDRRRFTVRTCPPHPISRKQLHPISRPPAPELWGPRTQDALHRTDPGVLF